MRIRAHVFVLRIGFLIFFFSLYPLSILCSHMIFYISRSLPDNTLFLHLLYAKIKVTDDVTIFDILDNRDQGISNALVNKQTTQSVVTCVEGESGKHC